MTVTTLIPLHDRVLVKRSEVSEVTKGGIYLPNDSQEKPQEGAVIAVGQGIVLEDGTTLPLNVSVGDNILFGKYSGAEIQIDGETLIMMREGDIFGILKKGKNTKKDVK